MNIWVYGLGILFGLYIIWGATVKTETNPYGWMHKQAARVFKSKAHTFMSFLGGAIVGTMIFFINL